MRLQGKVVAGVAVFIGAVVWMVCLSSQSLTSATDGHFNSDPHTVGPTFSPGVQRHPVDIAELKFHSGSVPTTNYKSFGLHKFAVGVLSDGVLKHRLDAALATWLRDTFHTFIYFSDVPESRRVATSFERSNVTVVTLTPPIAFKFGNWKNLPIVQHMASSETKDFLMTRYHQLPLWFVIVDDDTYILQPAITHILGNLTRDLENDSEKNIYAGHSVARCEKCKQRAKRFMFAFGGNGIFMSYALVKALALVIPQCQSLFRSLPGDEQIGGCIHRFHLAPLTHLSVGTETFAMAFGDKSEVLLEAPFPFAFHRITMPDWHNDMSDLERRHQGFILSWRIIANYFMVEKRQRYNVKEHVFRETINTTAVREFLSRKGI